jgi:hypothetical protein
LNCHRRIKHLENRIENCIKINGKFNNTSVTPLFINKLIVAFCGRRLACLVIFFLIFDKISEKTTTITGSCRQFLSAAFYTL